jgi:hypothetical protein
LHKPKVAFGALAVAAAAALIFAWREILDVGYFPEGLTGARLWYWTLIAFVVVAGFHGRRALTITSLVLAILFVLNLGLGFEYRQINTPHLAESVSPTGIYTVTVVDENNNDMMGDFSTTEIRVVRHAFVLDYRYARICQSDLGDQAVITWTGTHTFTLGVQAGDDQPLTVEIHGNRLKYEDTAEGWGDC